MKFNLKLSFYVLKEIFSCTWHTIYICIVCARPRERERALEREREEREMEDFHVRRYFRREVGITSLQLVYS